MYGSTNAGTVTDLEAASLPSMYRISWVPEDVRTTLCQFPSFTAADDDQRGPGAGRSPRAARRHEPTYSTGL